MNRVPAPIASAGNPPFSSLWPLESSVVERLLQRPSGSREAEADIRRITERGSPLHVSEAATLLAWADRKQRRDDLLHTAHRVHSRAAGNIVDIVIPQYLTNVCQNECLYCGYRKSNLQVARRRLELDEFARELEGLLKRGYRQVELVMADDPEFGPARLVKYVRLARRMLDHYGGGLLALNAPPYEQDDYEELKDAGLDWVALWQETYAQPYFNRWHPVPSPKQRFPFRLDIWDRVLQAGLRNVALGVLFGLYYWRFDLLALIAHGAYLRDNYHLEPFAIGIPRLKPAHGAAASQKTSKFTISEDDFRLAVAILLLAFPRSRLFFNTRETYSLNQELFCGGNLFTVDCETFPGAYSGGHISGQFSTHTYPPTRQVLYKFRARGYKVEHFASPGTPL